MLRRGWRIGAHDLDISTEFLLELFLVLVEFDVLIGVSSFCQMFNNVGK